MHISKRRSKGFSGTVDNWMMWFHSKFPSWITGVEVVDVEVGRNSKEELLAILPTLKGKMVLLSPRAQFFLWEIFRDEQADLDGIYQMSLAMPEPEGTETRKAWFDMQNELDKRADLLLDATREAVRKGMPEANAEDWKLVEYVEEERTGGVPGAIVAAGVVVAVATILGITVVIVYGVKMIGNSLSDAAISHDGITAFRTAVNTAIAEGHPEYILGITKAYFDAQKQKKEEEPGFPWMWVIGVGTVLIGGAFFVKWVGASIGKKKQ